MERKELKNAHENAVLESYKALFTSKGETFEVMEQPDPPDAIVEINGKRTWIEITDAFINTEWAKTVTSYASEDKPDIPYPGGVMISPDKQAAERVKEVILRKYEKTTIKDISRTLGSGTLLVGAYTPLTLPEEIVEQFKDEILHSLPSERTIFSQIYIYRNSNGGHLFTKLL